MIAKAGLGLVGLGAIGIGGVAFVKPEWLGINKETPWTSLAKDHDYNSKKDSDYKSANFGGKYKYYLVGVVGTNKETTAENTNKAMWDELFKKWDTDFKDPTKKSNLGNKFKDQLDGSIKTTSSSGNESKYLNTLCGEVYKVEESKVDANGSGEDKYKESSVWKYCSPLGQKPTTVKDHDRKGTGNKYENEDGGEKIGKKQESDLISVFDKGNDVFWNIRNKEIKDGTLSVGDTHTFFKKVKDENKHIKDLCSEAYEKQSSPTEGSTSPTADETKKYCSLDRE